ncbi:MAG: hypothetical protein Q7T74_07605 [Candidatus Saccharibacteria bacterium]|nr:hypothetical protein [Candidatus Saccharibacteria bacterium]
MNNRRQFIIIAIALFILVALVSITIINSGDSTKKNKDEIAETEKSLPVHRIFYSPPVTDINGPFTLEFMYKKNNVDYIKITDSSPQGRMNAMHWLRTRGVDPTDLSIRFDDFKNPLSDRGN